mmetsp:Transcript_21376/g.42383  ORF Transcript_21376/g.42383 Transcript_21376/m.42383 type:complete len:225 (+) Transcript_21376:42-716(+)
MATFMTGDTSGGIKKSSGVVIGSSIASGWARVRDNEDASTNWILLGYHPPESKTNVEVVAYGPGSFDDLMVQAKDPKYASHCLFGGFRDGDKFAHFTWVGLDTGAMAKGRASLHKNAVLSELEGCIREETIIQGEEGAPSWPAESPPQNESLPPSPAAAETPPQLNTQTNPQSSKTPLDVDSKAFKFMSIGSQEFVQMFRMTREEFNQLPTWKQNNAKKAKDLF